MELIYYGNGPVVAQVLTSVSYLLNSPSYYTLLQLVLVLAGLLIVSRWRAAATGGPHLSMHHLSVSALLVLVLFYGGYAAKTDVVVYDPINHFQTSIRNIPEGAALVVWVSDQLQNGFAKLFDEGFAYSGFPDQFNYQNTGGKPASLLAITSLSHIAPYNYYTLRNLEKYIRNCYFVAVELGKKDINDLYTSANLMQTLSVNLPTAWTTTYSTPSNPAGEILSCSVAWQKITSDILNSVTSGNIARELVQYFHDVGIIAATTYDAQNILTDAAQYMFSSTQDARELLAQAVLINAFNPELSQFATQTGVPSNAYNAAITQSILNTKNSMATSYALATAFLPLAYLVVNSLIIAILPLGFALMFVPSLTRKYGLMLFDLLLWIAFWGPVASVVNFLVQAYASSNFHSATGTALTLQNFTYLTTHSQTLVAIAGDLMFSVPLIAFALASGSAYALTGMVTSVSGLSRSIAQGASSRFSTFSGLESEDRAGRDLAEKSAMGDKIPDIEYDNSFAEGIRQSAFQKYIRRNMHNDWNAYTAESENKIAYDINRNLALGSTAEATMTGKVEGIHQREQALQNIQNAIQNFNGNVNEEQAAMIADTLLHTTGDWKALQQKWGSTAEKLLQNTSTAKYMQEITTYDQLKAAGGGDPERGAVMFAIANLNSLRHNVALTDYMKKHNLLPQSYDKLSPQGQIFMLWSGLKQLGATVHDLNLGDKHIESLSTNAEGRVVQETAQSGTTEQYVTPVGFVTRHLTPDGHLVQQDINGQFSHELGYYGNVGNAVTMLFRSGSVQSFVEGLKNLGLYKVLGENNIQDWEAVTAPLANNYAEIETMRYMSSHVDDIRKSTEKSSATDRYTGANVHAGIGASIKGVNIGAGGDAGIRKDIREANIQSKLQGHGGTYETTYNQSLAWAREHLMDIYNRTQGIKNPELRAEIRARLIANTFRNAITTAKIYEEQGITTPAPTPDDIPILTQGKPQDFKNNTNNTFEDEIELMKIRSRIQKEKNEAVGPEEKDSS